MYVCMYVCMYVLCMYVRRHVCMYVLLIKSQIYITEALAHVTSKTLTVKINNAKVVVWTSREL